MKLLSYVLANGAAIFLSILDQKPVSRCLLCTVSLSQLLYQETHICINLHSLFLLFFSSFDNFILIAYFKQCLQSRRLRGVLKVERYPQRLTHGLLSGWYRFQDFLGHGFFSYMVVETPRKVMEF